MQTERHSIPIQTDQVHDLARQQAQVLRDIAIADFWRSARRAWVRLPRIASSTHLFPGV